MGDGGVRSERWTRYVKRLVDSRFKTQDALAKTLGVSGSTITRWLDGAVPEISTFQAMSRDLGVPLIDLFIEAEVLDAADVEARRAGESISTDILTAIEADIELLDEAREHLRNQYQLLRRLGPELSDRSRTTTSPRAATPRPTRRLRPVAHEGDPAHADVIDEMAREVRRQYEEGDPDR